MSGDLDSLIELDRTFRDLAISDDEGDEAAMVHLRERDKPIRWIDSFCRRCIRRMMFKSPMWIAPLPKPLTALGQGSHGSILSGSYAPIRLSSGWKSTLVYIGAKKSWALPCGGKAESFETLLTALRQHWTGISSQYPNVEDPAVVGIDLTLRGLDANTVKAATKARKSAEREKRVAGTGLCRPSSPLRRNG